MYSVTILCGPTLTNFSCRTVSCCLLCRLSYTALLYYCNFLFCLPQLILTPMPQADERIEILEQQIAKDTARITELERIRVQFEQLQEFKKRWIASQVG